MRALGISTTTIYRPVLYFSLCVFLINLLMMNIALPYGNHALVDLLYGNLHTDRRSKKRSNHAFFTTSMRTGSSISTT